MLKLRELKPNTFIEFIQAVAKIQEKTEGSLWFRGCCNGAYNYNLVPSLFRHGQIKQIEKLIELEFELMTRFRQRSIPFHDKVLDDDWSALFFMQHYGIPTRLLDWTENPFIAFFFAVMQNNFFERSRLGYKNDAVIWILDPTSWNRRALKHESFDRGILSTSDEQLKGYKPTGKFSTGMNNFPVALYGAHNSSRIVAQRGVFVIFGQNTMSMDKLYYEEKFPQDSIVKIILNKERLPKMRLAIINHGITESVVFPDLIGLSEEIRRTFGFEVYKA